ncbi:VanZ family protein [Curtobacterium sp. 9128]|uniref:VanZ family protein n=1 Tax=Curtobacterium sp. 9128 TaxID=1793722 RepID=UPI002481AF29|nr:VanZ family protein [Curtobacterium sp. 9128]
MIALGVVIFLVLLWTLRARGRVTLPRASVAAVLALYAGGVIANTVFPIFIHVGTWPDRGPRPLSLWLVPFVDYGREDALINVAVFVPLGVLIPLLLARPSWWRVTAIVAGASLAIELTQMATAGLAFGGHIADINDWMTNIVGGVIGFGLFVLVTRSKTVAGVVQRFRWPTREAASFPSA